MSARAQVVLDRFPLHLAATDPEKRFEHVVTALVGSLEVLTRQVADVRRSHRLGEAPTVGDLLALAGLHGLPAASLDLLLLRLAAIPADAPEATLTRHRPSLELRRDVVRGAIHAHRVGNGTATALLSASAAYLGFTVARVDHDEHRWWHVAECLDALDTTTPQTDLLALEENPFRRADLAPTPKVHAQTFRVLRGGIDDVAATVRVLGVGGRTVRPMVVERHAGRGLCFEGEVADGAELRFEASGRVTLDGTDVTGSTWAFHGAVFASSTERHSRHDFVFADAADPPPALLPDPPDLDGAGDDDPDEVQAHAAAELADRRARFAVTMPVPDAFGPDAPLPHGAATVPPMRLPRGVSAWTAFARPAHTSSGGPAGLPARHQAARFDAAVLADADGPAGVTLGQPSMKVGFDWEEREPFAVRVLLPRRLGDLDDDRGSRLREPLRRLLDRHRAVGVDVRVEYADPRWTLGTGVVRQEPDNALGTVLSGTELWPDGTPQPGNG